MDREGRVRGRAEAPAEKPPEASEGERPEVPERTLEETFGERAAERAGRLAAVATEALRTAGLRAPVAALCAGLAGLDPGTRRVLGWALEERGLAARMRLTNDAEVAHFDAFRDGPGILLAAGTGSVAWGRGSGGWEGRVGGLGPLLGDDGSGWDLARRALRAAARAAEGRGPSTDLLPLLAARLGTEEDGRALAAAAAGRSRAELAVLAPVVLDASVAGDGVAEAIAASAAAELALHVEVLARRLGPWQGLVPLALTGGLLGEGAFRERVVFALGDRVRVREGRADGGRGAARMARAWALPRLSAES